MKERNNEITKDQGTSSEKTCIQVYLEKDISTPLYTPPTTTRHGLAFVSGRWSSNCCLPLYSSPPATQGCKLLLLDRSQPSFAPIVLQARVAVEIKRFWIFSINTIHRHKALIVCAPQLQIGVQINWVCRSRSKGRGEREWGDFQTVTLHSKAVRAIVRGAGGSRKAIVISHRR